MFKYHTQKEFSEQWRDCVRKGQATIPALTVVNGEKNPSNAQRGPPYDGRPGANLFR
jgi:hypothetical protein